MDKHIILDVIELIVGSLIYFLTKNFFTTILAVIIITALKILYIYVTEKKIILADHWISFVLVFSGALSLVSKSVIFFQIKAMLSTAIAGFAILFFRIAKGSSILDKLLSKLPINNQEKISIDFEVAGLFFLVTLISTLLFIYNKVDEWFYFKSFTVPALFAIYIAARIYLIADRIFEQK